MSFQAVYALATLYTDSRIWLDRMIQIHNHISTSSRHFGCLPIVSVVGRLVMLFATDSHYHVACVCKHRDCETYWHALPHSEFLRSLQRQMKLVNVQYRSSSVAAMAI